jgi:8-oxo-dGTP diphosphatase
LLRHSEAGKKRTTAGDDPAEDLARPLDDRGVAEAQELALVLASYGKSQVISSAAERCLATVRPYAEAVGAQVRVEPALTVVPGPIAPAVLLAAAADRDAQTTGNGGRSTDEAAQLAAELAVSGAPTLICAHRENLPAIIDAVFTALGSGPPGAKPLGKSEFWVLHSAAARFVAAERDGLSG